MNNNDEHLKELDKDIEEIDQINIDLQQFAEYTDLHNNNNSSQFYQNQLPQINEAPDESQGSIVRKDDIVDIQDNYEIPVLILDENSQISESTKIKLSGFKNFIQEKEQEQKRIETQFQRIVQQKAKELIDEQKNIEIIKQLQNTIKPSKLQLKVQQLLGEVQVTQSELLEKYEQIKQQKEYKNIQQKSHIPQGNNKILQDQLLNAQKLIEDYKIQHNDDQQIIKVLKARLNKLELNTSKSTNTTSISKSDELIFTNEKIKEEVISLKKQLIKEREDHKQQLQKVQRIQSGLQQQKTKDIIPIDKATEEISKLKAEITAQACQFRNKEKQLQEQLDKNKQEILQLNQQINKLIEQKDKPDQQKQKIINLENDIKILNINIQTIKEEYSFDNQIKLIFPNKQEQVIKILNILMKLEENKLSISYISKNIIKFISPFFYSIIKYIKWFIQLFKFQFNKQPILHPDNQTIIKEAMKKIRANPTILEQQNYNLQKQINILSQENKEIFNKFELQKFQVQESIERQKSFEELIKLDKIKLANQLMMRILKKEAEDNNNIDKQDIPELEIIKKYAELILKSTNPQLSLQQIESNKQKQETKSNQQKNKMQSIVKVQKKTVDTKKSTKQ